MKSNSQKEEILSRIQVLCSDLRDFHADFIRCATVFGLCRAKNIPDKFKPKDKDLPDNNIEYRLRISFGTNQHKFHFSKMIGQEPYNWTINNTGLANYIDMVGDIWPEGNYSWLVERPEHVELLNKKADSIYELAKPLLEEREYRGVASKVREIVRCNGGQWTDRTNVDLSYPEDIEKMVKELEKAIIQKPAETDQKAAPSPINIQNSNVILGNVQKAENIQTGDHALIQKQTITKEKNRGIVKKVLTIAGAIIVSIIAAVVTDILGDFGLIERIKDLFTK